MDCISEIFSPRAVKTYTELNCHNIPFGLNHHCRPAEYVRVNGGITVVLWLPAYRGFGTQYLHIPYGDNWIGARELGKELEWRAHSCIASRHFSSILLKLPSWLRPQPQFTAAALTIWDVLKLSGEIVRVAELIANGGRAPGAYL